MGELKIEKNDNDYAIELGKRASIPWMVTANCPKCGEPSKYNLNQGDSIFLHAEAPFKLTFCCYTDDDTCSHEWEEWIFVEMLVRPATEQELKDWE